MRFVKLAVAAAALAAGIAAVPALQAQDAPARMERVPDRQPGEGEGPFRRLVIRGAMLIDGSGAPPRGPVDIVIAGNRIESINGAGTPGLPLAARPRAARRRPRDRRAPACTSCPASSTRTAIMAIRTRRRTRPTATGCGSPTASPRCAASALYGGPDNMSLSDRQRSARQHDRRAAAVRLYRCSATPGAAATVAHARAGARLGALGGGAGL